MKPPPPSKYVSQNSKKRVSSGSGSSSFMDPEVIEIPPPVPRSFRSKQKQAIIHEVIDIDNDEESAEVTILDVKPNIKDKGKALENSSGGYGDLQVKDSLGATNQTDPPKNSGSRSHNLVHADSDLSFDEDYFDFMPNVMNADDLAMIQAHFDSVDLPAGVEAPIPWFPDFSPSKKKAFKGSSSSDDHGRGSVKPWPFGSSKPSHGDNKVPSASSSSLLNPINASIHPTVLGQPSPFPLISPPGGSKNENKPAVSNPGGINLNHPFTHSSVGSFSTNANLYQSGPTMPPFGVGPPTWGQATLPGQTAGAAGSSSFPEGFFDDMDSLDDPLFPQPAMSWWKQPWESISVLNNLNSHVSFHEKIDGLDITPQELVDIRRNQKTVNEEDILSKFKLFKKFDTVEDFSDHHYSNKGVKQPAKSWIKKIQDEWRILENDLPDTIFVRVCETRMDLLRAVIIGAEGTPYHDGLFFFDVFFPASYPKVPPNVYYHSGGLRLNPNLYNCGKVCLSLLNTWSGDKNEKWIPGTSTMLQVLVSIQALILNQKPYFNEPGYANLNGTPQGEIMSQQYNENTFILSLRTMLYTMRRPPKHFEDFVVGHFYIRAHDIIVACKAYLDGAQVGCLVKGGVQDVDEGDKSCSKRFKESMPGCLNLLLKEFTILGAKDCEKFLIDMKNVKNQAANTPMVSRKSSSKSKV